MLDTGQLEQTRPSARARVCWDSKLVGEGRKMPSAAIPNRLASAPDQAPTTRSTPERTGFYTDSHRGEMGESPVGLAEHHFGDLGRGARGLKAGVDRDRRVVIQPVGRREKGAMDVGDAVCDQDCRQ
jgi:hypothetical protein